MTDFSTFSLSQEVLQAVEELGFEKATPIQAKAIPSLISQERDFIGLAHTGTGKTAAFALPLIENLEVERRYIQGLIIAPTRELVKQIEAQIGQLSKYVKGFKSMAVYGGTSIQTQIRDLRKAPHLLIATPGRLMDLMRRKIVVVKDVSIVVLDEADEMLNMGFKEDIDTILSSMEGEHNTWLFSATFPKEIRRISKEYMNDPLEFAVDSVKETNANIKHEFCVVKGATKTEFLKRVLDAESEIRGIVFCRTKRGTQSLSDDLLSSGYQADALHGDMSQAQRERTMKRFRNYQLQILVATDVAARGIDVSDLTHVIHYDIPDDLSYYTHRSGRTGRAGKKGISLLFAPPSQQRRVGYLERMLKIKFEKANIPDDGEIIRMRMLKWATNIAQMKELDFIDPEIMKDMYQVLGNFTKEELIEKMVTGELNSLNYASVVWKIEQDKQKKAARKAEKAKQIDTPRKAKRDDRREDRREVRREDRREDKRKNKGRSGRGEREDAKTLVSFFINVGFMDGVGKRDLLTYLAEQCKLEMGAFQNLKLHRKHAFFEAPVRLEGKIINSFKNVRISNRKLRVNRNHT